MLVLCAIPLCSWVSSGCEMIKYHALMFAALLLIVGCMFYPFLPGNYDGLAVTLSVMAQLFGMAGLLLVPLGAVWLVYELKMRSESAQARPGKNLIYWF